MSLVGLDLYSSQPMSVLANVISKLAEPLRIPHWILGNTPSIFNYPSKRTLLPTQISSNTRFLSPFGLMHRGANRPRVAASHICTAPHGPE